MVLIALLFDQRIIFRSCSEKQIKYNLNELSSESTNLCRHEKGRIKESSK